MIYDTIENMKTYRDIPVLRKAIDFIETHDLSELEPGRHEIEGDRIFIEIQEYVTKNPEDARVETHKSYIDLQIMLKGAETIGYAGLTDCGEPIEAHPEKDVWFYNAEVQSFVMRDGMCMILFPQDGHQPQVRYKYNQKVHKAVIKIHI